LTARRPLAVAAALLASGLLLAACQKEMRDLGRIRPYESNAFFLNEQSARPLPEGVLAVEGMPEDEPYFTGRDEAGDLLATAPVSVTMEILETGRERYDIFCSPCHGLNGYGEGIVTQRGFPAPPSLHEERLRAAPDGHFYDVITNGFGVMFPYNTRLTPDERWAVTAYIRALQLSQFAAPEDVPPGQEIEQP
jgi:mono/diheme cytochrome c family protein